MSNEPSCCEAVFAARTARVAKLRQSRTAMGEYIPPPDGHALTCLAAAMPSAADYFPAPQPTAKQFPILERNTHLVDKSRGPGPLRYDVNAYDHVGCNSPAWTLPARLPTMLSEHIPTNYSVPAPGEYNTYSVHDFGSRCAERLARGCTISGKLATANDDTPGPCHPPKAKTGPKFTIAAKLTASAALTPGPLDYDTAALKAISGVTTVVAGGSFSNAERWAAFKAMLNITGDCVPSPAAYYPVPTSTGRTVTLKGLAVLPTKVQSPGPGQYTLAQELGSNAPQISMKARNHPKLFDEVEVAKLPGPANYNPDYSKIDTTTRGNFTLNFRPPQVAEMCNTKIIAPAPNVYDTLKAIDSVKRNPPKFTLKSRFKETVRISPGPASYLPTKRIPFSIQPTGKPVDKGKGTEKIYKCTVEVRPSPADSHLSSKTTHPTAPCFSISSKLSEKYVFKTPAPEQYATDDLQKIGRIGVSLKSRPSPYLIVFQSDRIDTLSK